MKATHSFGDQTDQKEGFDVHIPELPQVEFGGKSDLSIAPSAACSRPIPEGFNLPKTELFWTNQRGHKLHIRHFEHENPLALVVLIHGYGAHMNSPHVYQTSCLYAKSLEAEIMTFDMQGHGYSEGPRGAVASFDDMAEDVESFMRLIYTAREAKGQDFHLCPSDALQRMQKLPFVLGGESMGAAVVLLAGLRLQVKPIPNGCFGGAVLPAPAVRDPSTGKGPTLLTRSLCSLVRLAPALGEVGVPKAFLPKFTGAAIFEDATLADHFDRDNSGSQSGSLGFLHTPMNARTGTAFVEMFQKMPTVLPMVKFRVLIFHEWISELIASTDKKLVPIPGGLHAPHFNRLDVVLPHFRDFLLRQVKKETSSESALGEEGRQNPGADAETALTNAMSKWPAPARTAPEVSLLFLLAYAVCCTSPLWVWALGEGWAGISVLAVLEATLFLLFACTLLAAMRMTRLLRASNQRAASPSQSPEVATWQHLVCVPVYNEPDEVVLATLSGLNKSAAAPRMRVVFAMEEATDRVDERFERYKQCLSRIPEVCRYVHPVGAVQGEVRGLCSNLAHAMSVDVPKLVHRCNGNVEALSKYVFTKLDSQVHLPPNYFEELEMSCQRVGREAVVFQPLPVNLVNRQLSHGPMRAIAAARTFSYPILFALNLMTVTCYSVPLVQYMKMGLTHAGYLGEDMMMLAQAASTGGGRARIVVLPVLVGVAPPVGTTLCGAMKAAAHQSLRWAGQTAEVAEFCWRFKAWGSACRNLWWLLKYWLIRCWLCSGIGLFSFLLLLAAYTFGSNLPEEQATMLSVMEKSMSALVLTLTLVMPFYEQYLASLVLDSTLSAPLSQLPGTLLGAPVGFPFSFACDLLAWINLLAFGKHAIASSSRRKVAATNQAPPFSDVCPSTL
ncbi:MGLL [Symbiodinium pilosum]|uniref:MGLL protein n=1 Tax=Symbiodinium pilosum TaxID=2952 RepID=A0A812QRC3_SYMPI|nr:MGLL [Symbiodinium pilosum]